eukprot:gene10730-12489_t
MANRSLLIALLFIALSSVLINVAYSQIVRQTRYPQKTNIAEHNVVEYDEDEFEGIEHLKPAEDYSSLVDDASSEAPVPEAGTVPINKEAEPQKSFFQRQKHWYLEISFIIFIIGYVVNYFVGKSTNQKIVTAWGRKFRPIFESNFTFLGDRESYVIMKVDPNTYTFICSGRINCHGAQVTLNLKKRQDLFTVLLDLVGYADPDRITIEVALTNMEPIVFAVVKQKAFKKFRADNNDVGLFASKVTNPVGLSASYAVLGDTEFTAPLILRPEVISTLNSLESFFDPHALSFSFKLPKITDIEKISPLTNMAIHFIDFIATTKLTPQHKLKAEKLREKQRETLFKQAHQERQELAQKKKFDKEREEKEKIGKLTPEEQRKRDEKEYKKQLKQRSGKRSKKAESDRFADF